MKSNELPLLALHAVTKHYDQENVRSVILRGINLMVATGELMAIVGSSGSGKSTLMNIMGLLDKPSSGEYLLDQRNVTSLTDDDLATLRNQTMGFVFQQFNLLPRFTVQQNVALPLRYRGLPDELIDTSIMTVLESVGMAAYLNYYPRQLSGGQQQRVAIARALIGDPQIILADEPTGALDSHTGASILELFHALHSEGRTILMVTHDERIAAACPRQITLADGQIIRERGQ